MTIPDGTEVIIDIPDSYGEKKPQWNELEKIIGIWENDAEITSIFTQIDQKTSGLGFNYVNPSSDKLMNLF